MIAKYGLIYRSQGEIATERSARFMRPLPERRGGMARQTVRAIGLVSILLVATVAWGVALAGATTAGATTDGDEPTAVDGSLEDGEQRHELTATERGTVQDEDENLSRIRVVHLSPLLPALTADVDSVLVAENASFGTVTDYEVVESGEQEFEIETTEEGEEILETDQTLEPDASYSFFAIADLTENGTVRFQPALLRDEFEAPSETRASIRFVHAAPDMSAVDVTIAETDTVIADDVQFREDGEYVTVPAGEVTLEVREEADDNAGDVIYRADFSLERGTVHSAAATGYQNPEAVPVDAPLDIGLFEDARLATNEAE